MKIKNIPALFITGLFILSGCYPEGPDYAEELDLVVTKHNEDYDFAAKATYAIPDQIVIITGSLVEGDEPEFIPDAFASQILGAIETNMSNLGWSKVDVSEDPDLLLLPASWETTTIYYWYDYWYWWYGGWYPYWGYYPPVYVDAYSTGSLLMTLKDPDVLEGTGIPVNQWVALLNGLMTGEYSTSRVTAAVDKAFKASPYLKTN